MTHICVSKLTNIGSNNGLSPGQRQAIIWTNAGILLIVSFRTHFREILINIYIFSFKKMHLKMSSGKWQPFCVGLDVLMRFSGMHLRSTSQKILLIKMSLKIAYKNLQHLPEVDKFLTFGTHCCLFLLQLFQERYQVFVGHIKAQLTLETQSRPSPRIPVQWKHLTVWPKSVASQERVEQLYNPDLYSGK